MNDLYAAYERDRDALEPLLEAVRLRASRVLCDDDLSQEFVISVWQALPTLVVRSSFSAWLNVRLRWHKLSALRAPAREGQAPSSPDDRDDEFSDDALERLAYEHLEHPANVPDLSGIADPTIRRAAELMGQGMTQAQAADALGLKPATLRQRLCRYRRAA